MRRMGNTNIVAIRGGHEVVVLVAHIKMKIWNKQGTIIVKVIVYNMFMLFLVPNIVKVFGQDMLTCGKTWAGPSCCVFIYQESAKSNPILPCHQLEHYFQIPKLLSLLFSEL